MRNLAKFIFEIGSLKRIHRAWFKAEGVPTPDTVAEHSYRVIMIGYILAKLEKADVDKVIRMCMFHDVPETRIGDLDKVAQGYIDADESEMKAFQDQMESVGMEENVQLLEEFNGRRTKESLVARDADTLELLFQAKEFSDSGHQGLLYWLDNNDKLLKTDSAKKLFKEMRSMHSTEWWKGLENLR